MPTPERIKLASLEKRKRTCSICGAAFVVRSVDRKGVGCSKECLREVNRRAQTGRKHTAEQKAKIAAANRAAWADPERAAKRQKTQTEAIRRWHAEPSNATAFSQRSSERMKRRHADPEWQEIRDKRSSRTMKANWEKHRDAFVTSTIERYWRERDAGIGLNSDAAKNNKAAANKWILKKAQAALHAETDFDEVYTETQHRLRREMPYDGPKEGSDYLEYCSKLGSAVCHDPEVRAIADSFMSQAIPKFAAEWQKRRSAQRIEAAKPARQLVGSTEGESLVRNADAP